MVRNDNDVGDIEAPPPPTPAPDYSRAYNALGGAESVNALRDQFLQMGMDENTIGSVFSSYYAPEKSAPIPAPQFGSQEMPPPPPPPPEELREIIPPLALPPPEPAPEPAPRPVESAYERIISQLGPTEDQTVGGQPAPPSNQLSGVILAGASWMAGDENTQLATEIFGQPVTNTAVGGQKTSDVLNQLNIFERDGGTFAPGSTVVLDVGANDIAQGVNESTIRNNLDEIISRLAASGVDVILSGQPEANSYEEAISRTNLQMDDLYSDLAKSHPNVTLVDAMSGFLNQKDLMDKSGFHLNSNDAKSAYLNKFADAFKKTRRG
jgi:hypothetical protein